MNEAQRYYAEGNRLADKRRKEREAEQAACDHKFVDSNSCLKCGWMPPSAPHGADTPGQEP